MTREEIEKAFPIGSKIFYNGKESFLYQQIAKVISYDRDSWTWYLNIEWEDKNLREKYPSVVESAYFSLVLGPAVQEPDHEGMIYNPFTGRWSWF